MSAGELLPFVVACWPETVNVVLSNANSKKILDCFIFHLLWGCSWTRFASSLTAYFRDSLDQVIQPPKLPISHPFHDFSIRRSEIPRYQSEDEKQQRWQHFHYGIAHGDM